MMRLHDMDTLAWPRILLEAAHARGFLTRMAKERALLLIEEGLHPEQALLGTGLLTRSQYGELVKVCFQTNILSLDMSETHERSSLRADAWVSKDASLGVPVLRSDVERYFRRHDPLDLSVAWWLEKLAAHRVTEARIGLEQGQGVVLLGSEQRLEPTLTLSREEVPAVQAWLETGYGSKAWHASREEGLEGDWLTLVSRQENHPLTSRTTWKTWFARPQGMVFVIQPDAWLLHELSQLSVLQQQTPVFDAPRMTRVVSPNEQERELALHTVFAGCPVCWVDEDARVLQDARPLAKRGIPVRVIRRRPTCCGSAWELYTV